MVEKNKKTILAIDDEMSVQESMKLLFEDEYNIITTGSVKESFGIIKKQKIDLVLLDIRMPEMWGVEVLKKIKEINEDIKVIMVTAVYNIETGVDALSYGAHDYVVKPFDVQELKERVKQLIG